MSQTINTVAGPISPEQLGSTLMHEHFLYGFAGWQADCTVGRYREDAYMADCLEMISEAKTYVNTIVDATTNECGRNPRFLKKLSDQTGFNIICSTGYYFEDESSYAYWKFRKGFADIQTEIYDMMATELTKGIDGTDIKAGVIKLGTSYGRITPMEEIFFKAAARAQRETGCVIITHTQLGTMGPEQAQLLISEGADPKKIAIGHMCGNTDVDYHEQVLQQGVYVNLDRFGLEGDLFHTPTDSERTDLIVKLVARGWGDKILLGHDFVKVNLGRPVVMNDFMKQAFAHVSITDIKDRVMPWLAERGISRKQIQAFLLDNPRAIFS